MFSGLFVDSSIEGEVLPFYEMDEQVFESR
jgi:hypothetical protein